MKNKVTSCVMATVVALSAIGGVVFAAESNTKELALSHLSSYFTGTVSEDGAAAEIVKFNPDNNQMYVINGVEKVVDIAEINEDGATKKIRTVDLSKMIQGFTFGDVTSVDINTKDKLIAMAVQEEDYTAKGAVVILDYDGNLVKSVPVGVQPDMVKFTSDGSKILTADEGEPRNGYGEGVVDPKGTVSIVDISNGVKNATSKIVDFTKFDEDRDELINNQVLLKKDALPSEDLEPEYIVLSGDGKTAYVSLQEANSIAILDIEKGEFTSVKGLGFKDHSIKGNELDIVKDRKIAIKNEDNLYGVYMPDGISTYDVNGKTYIITANEGDAREYITKDMPWIDKANEFNNLKKLKIEGQSVDALDPEKHDGLDLDKNYVLGGRSFSIWDADTMEQIFDSGSDFEKITAEKYPEFFNCSNKNTELDNRSGKKGPEPEDVQVGFINDQAYAFVGIERIGGLMAYNITDPTNPYFVDYINNRDFSEDIKGDVGAEGICFVSSDESPTNKPMVLVSNENSGTVSIFDINTSHVNPADIKYIQTGEFTATQGKVEKSIISGKDVLTLNDKENTYVYNNDKVEFKVKGELKDLIDVDSNAVALVGTKKDDKFYMSQSIKNQKALEIGVMKDNPVIDVNQFKAKQNGNNVDVFKYGEKIFKVNGSETNGVLKGMFVIENEAYIVVKNKKAGTIVVKNDNGKLSKVATMKQ